MEILYCAKADWRDRSLVIGEAGLIKRLNLSLFRLVGAYDHSINTTDFKASQCLMKGTLT